MRWSRLLLVVLFAPVTAAGCLTAVGDGFTATETVSVLVTDGPDGTPIPGANVTLHVQCFFCSFEEEREQEHHLSTDEGGVATAKIPRRNSLAIVVEKPGFTTETVPRFNLDARSAYLEVPLYTERATYMLKGRLDDGAASLHRAGPGDFVWNPLLFEFTDDPKLRHDYAIRTAYLNLTVRWVNTPTAAGDLGVAIGSSSGSAEAVGDSEDSLLPGAQVDELRLTWKDLARVGTTEDSEVYIGAGTGTAYASTDAIEYEIDVEAFFDGSLARRESPGPGGLMGAIGALAFAALARRKST